MKMTENEKNYVIWQNRAIRFYIGARLLYLNQQYSPAAFCAIQTIESMMKATLVYWDKSFIPEGANHKVGSMISTIKNKTKNGKGFSCPGYFFQGKRYQSISRYPSSGKGVLVPGTFLDDLDDVICSLIKLVPFQFNTNLKHALSGKDRKNLNILRRNNKQMRALRNYLKISIKTKA
jgi:HEPN domain-containing protein